MSTRCAWRNIIHQPSVLVFRQTTTNSGGFWSVTGRNVEMNETGSKVPHLEMTAETCIHRPHGLCLGRTGPFGNLKWQGRRTNCTCQHCASAQRALLLSLIDETAVPRSDLLVSQEPSELEVTERAHMTLPHLEQNFGESTTARKYQTQLSPAPSRNNAASSARRRRGKRKRKRRAP